MRRRVMVIGMWLLGTGFAMAMAGLAVQLAGARVIDADNPTLDSASVLAQLEADDHVTEGSPNLVLGTSSFLEGGSEVASPGGGDPADLGTPGGEPGGGTPSSTTGAGGASANTGATTAPSPQSSGAGGGGGTPTGGSGAPPPSPTPAPTTASTIPPPPPPTSPSATHTLASVGGTMTMHCSGDDASIVAASPSAGFDMDVRDQGPSKVEVRFDSDEHQSTVKAECDGGAPIPEVEEEPK